MRLTIISDTHGKHKKVQLAAGDVLIHCGDISLLGCKRDIISFYEWFAQQPFIYKIFIAGNHDHPLDQELSHIKKWVPYNCQYLENSGVEINGLRIWGSPVTPRFKTDAFTLAEQAQLAEHWAHIPHDTDILLTHGPAHGTCDTNSKGILSGCTELRRALTERRVKVHAYGHIHEAHGVQRRGDLLSINASVVNTGYEVVNPAITLTYRDGQFDY